VRRAIILGVLAQPIFFGISVGLRSDKKSLGGTGAPRLKGSQVFDEGDAVTRPGLELDLLGLIETKTPYTPSGKSIPQLVSELEDFQGSQLGAAAGTGKWVIPWVGGWDRLWANGKDARYLGGPAQTEVSYRGRTYQQTSQRQFIYGPGESGATVEYLYSMPGAPAEANKLLLTRKATVANQGDLEFTFGFDDKLSEFEVASNVESRSQERGVEFGDAVRGPEIEGGAERETAGTVRLKSTYLSERLWIVRDVKEPDQVSVFVRTETRSVSDRRGLVAEGQMKPDQVEEQVRYGGLLFGESIQDYANWDVKERKANELREKLMLNK